MIKSEVKLVQYIYIYIYIYGLIHILRQALIISYEILTLLRDKEGLLLFYGEDLMCCA